MIRKRPPSPRPIPGEEFQMSLCISRLHNRDYQFRVVGGELLGPTTLLVVPAEGVGVGMDVGAWAGAMYVGTRCVA